MNVLIAGGSGFIGTQIKKSLEQAGHQVSILSRNPSHASAIFWDPYNGKLDHSAIVDTEVLINLSGAGIADQRWTRKRKQELEDSRVKTNTFLAQQLDYLPKLQQFISASGITCYGFNEDGHFYREEEAYGEDYISQLVKDWEKSADLFAVRVPACKLRIAVVLSESGGALKRMIQPINLGVGSPIGNGKQIVQWVHMDDLARIFVHALEHRLEGAFNTCAGSNTNAELTSLLAKKRKKPLWMPNVPSFLMQLLFGEMAVLLLEGVKVSNEKLISTGFHFDYPTLPEAIDALDL